jgi:hypothetical protein
VNSQRAAKEQPSDRSRGLGGEVLLGDLSELFGLHPARVDHENVQRALLLEDRREQGVLVCTACAIDGDGGDAVADQGFGLVQLALAAPGNKHVRPFLDEPLCGR